MEQARAEAHALGLLSSELYGNAEDSRTAEGYYRVQGGVEYCCARALAFAPHADLLWMETKVPTLQEANVFASAVHKRFPGKLLAYNLSPSFNWDQAGLDATGLESFVHDLARMGYVWQFITLAGFHADALAIDTFAADFVQRGMLAYVERIQRAERAAGVETLQHQKWSGAHYMDRLMSTALGGSCSVSAMGKGNTESQFSLAQ